MTALGLFLSWIAVQMKWIHGRHAALEWAHDAYSAKHDYKPAPWSIRLFERGVTFIVVEPTIAEAPAKVTQLKRLFPEARVLTTAFPPPDQTGGTYRYKEL